MYVVRSHLVRDAVLQRLDVVVKACGPFRVRIIDDLAHERGSL